MTLDEANAMSREEFVARFGGVIEHSPWAAENAAEQRPFTSRKHLYFALWAQVAVLDEAGQLGVLRAHPELAGKAALAGTLTDESAREQDAAGLRQCSAAELQALQRMNAQYRERFGFPFIVAVRGLDRVAILAQLEARLGNDRATEFTEALRQVARIVAARLDALVEA